MPVLHEILAVESQLNTNATAVAASIRKNLGKESIYKGMVKRHEIFDEEKQHLVQPNEHMEVQSTVDMQLDYLASELGKAWDIYATKEATNQVASADILTEDGQLLASNVPAIVLLGLETRLDKLMAIYKDIPTLDSARAWEVDPSANMRGIFRTKYDTERFQTVTKKEFITVVEATKEHPAQVTQQDKTENIGKYIQTDFSGAITSFDKAERIQRLASLQRAVKKARQRANSAQVVELQLAQSLFNYINNG